MIRLSINEHDRIFKHDDTRIPVPDNGRIYLNDRYFRLLQKFDRKHSAGGNDVFTWFSDHVQAKQWVGVIQLQGLVLEILPKIDEGDFKGEDQDEKQYEARKNLLYMLSISGDVPVRSRDFAKIASRKAPLNETLCSLFAKRLLAEILRGSDRSYIEMEENIRSFKGRLVLNRHLLKNTGHRERFFCRFDEFSSDTPLNRVLKAALKVMLEITRLPATQETLKNCLLLMEHVTDEAYPESLFAKVVINRKNSRFQDLFEFARLILTGYSPTVSAGTTRSFSLLFDMNVVFERFIAAFIQKHVMAEFEGFGFFPQAIHNRRHLMRLEPDRGVLALEPDMLIRNPSGKFLVIDTKWKKTGTGGGLAGVKNSDLYQLYAYTHRYGSSNSILLYPHIPDVAERDYSILDEAGNTCGKKVSVRFVQLNRNLYSEEERMLLKNELTQLIREGFVIHMDDNGLQKSMNKDDAFFSTQGSIV